MKTDYLNGVHTNHKPQAYFNAQVLACVTVCVVEINTHRRVTFISYHSENLTASNLIDKEQSGETPQAT